jgi:hypothetical protein
MANEDVNILEPTVQPSPLNVTALLKRETDPEPTTDQALFGNVTALPKREADPKPMDQEPPQNATAPPKGEAELEESQRRPAGHDIPAITESIVLEKLGESELMIAHAAETGKDLNPEVVATITNARDAYARHAWTTDLTKQFWPAFGQLCASIKPVTGESLLACGGNGLARTLKRYRTGTFYLVFLILPLSILMFINTSISNEINDRIKENNGLVVTLHDQLLNIQAGRVQNERDVSTELQQSATSNRSLYALALLLNHFILNTERDPLSDTDKRQALQLPVPLTDTATAGFDKLKTYQDIRTFARDVQQMNLVIYGAITAYFLPILYALLGACAYALRSLSQQILARTYTPTYADFARIVIAVIAGLVVGLFSNFTQGISLSPLAVAFLVGYAVEIFFSFLDAFLETLIMVRS